MLPSIELILALAGLAITFFLLLLWKCNAFCHTSPYGVLYNAKKAPCEENEEEKSDKWKKKDSDQQQSIHSASLLPQNNTFGRQKAKNLKSPTTGGNRKELVENEVDDSLRKHDMKTFLCEDEKTGWNAGFSFHYTEAEWEALDKETKTKTRLRQETETRKTAHYTPTTNRDQGSVPNCVVMVPARRAKNITDDKKATETGGGRINMKNKNLFDEIERLEEDRKRLKAKNDAFFAKLGNAPLELKKISNCTAADQAKNIRNQVHGNSKDAKGDSLSEQKAPPRRSKCQNIVDTNNKEKEWEAQPPKRNQRRRNSEPLGDKNVKTGRTTVKVINCVAITVGEASPKMKPRKPSGKTEKPRKTKIDVPRQVEPAKEQNFYQLPVKVRKPTPPPPPCKSPPLPPPPPPSQVPSPIPKPVLVEKREKRKRSPAEVVEKRRWSSDVSVTPFRHSSDRRNFITDAMFAGSIYVGEKENVTDYEKLGVPSVAKEEFTSWREKFNRNMKS